MIADQSFYRQDITEGKTGLALSITFLVVDVSGGCAPVADATVQIWHCDATGVYSEYSGQPGAADQTGTTYLRGLQKTDANGQVKFKTIYPGWYMGRATHVHIEVYVGGVLKKTTQMAFPEATTAAVYNSGVYAAHGQNTTSNASDMVFGDGDTLELGSLTGDTTNGYAASLTIGI
jgi:protocatechuate 3,4-dioxygenase beta subunit